MASWKLPYGATSIQNVVFPFTNRRMFRLPLLLGAVFLVACLPTAANEPAPQARLGFSVELMAAEPLIGAPVAFDWGADGKFWVVEMRDYPLGLDNHGQAGGRIVVLGCYTRGGTVVTTGCTEWVRGLSGRDANVERITRNILDQLAR